MRAVVQLILSVVHSPVKETQRIRQRIQIEAPAFLTVNNPHFNALHSEEAIKLDNTLLKEEKKNKRLHVRARQR